MKNKLTRVGRKFAKQQIIFITLVVLFASIVTWFLLGELQAKSVLTGGVVALIPQTVFAIKAFKYAGASASKLVVDSFFSGVKLKMILTAFLFALSFKFLVLLPIPFFSMFCVVMLLPLLTPLFIKNNG
ncbi:MAG: ATP synthase subunit I [Pseudoalteromonas marina]